jgi:hypothetical protein
VPAATDACAALLGSEYPNLRAEADCIVAYGVAIASERKRSVAVLDMKIPDLIEPVWLALSNGEGFTTFHRLDDFQSTALSWPQFTIDTLTFRADESELLVEWRALDHGGEAVSSDDWEFLAEREGITLCRWSSAEDDASIACQNVERRRLAHETRWRRGRLVSRMHRESRVLVSVAEGGALEVREVPGASPDELRPTLGSYAWGAWPAIPAVAFP